MFRRNASGDTIAWLDNGLDVPNDDSIQTRLEGDDPQTKIILRCLANNSKGLRCGCTVKRNLQQHDKAVRSFRRLKSIPIDQPKAIRRICNGVKLESIFCFSHKGRVQNILNDELQFPDDAEPHSELTPKRTDAAPTNFTSKTPKVLHRNNARTGQVQLEPTAMKENVRNMCKQPFRKKKHEPESGFIYVLQYVGSEHTEYLKIGYTTQAALLRAYRISQRCRDHIKVLYESEKVVHPSRIESLIHKQLETVRYNKTNCSSCSKTHKELFRIREEDVVNKVGSKVNRWAKWMREDEPYTAKKDGKGRYRFYFKSEMESSLDSIISEFIDEAMLAGELYCRGTMSPTLNDYSFQRNRGTPDLECNADLKTIDNKNSDLGDPRESTTTEESPCLPRYAEATPSTVIASSSTATSSRPIPGARHTRTSSLSSSRRSPAAPVARSRLLPASFDTWQDQSFHSRPSALPTPDKTPSPGFENPKIVSEADAINCERAQCADSRNNSFSYRPDKCCRADEINICFHTWRLLTPETKLRFNNLAEEIREECEQKRSTPAYGTI